ncbi:MAG: hypothetical protein V4530_14375 [Pseudomonadota bacterium]
MGQAAAYASAPVVVSTPMAMSVMNADCMKTMAQQQPAGKPCKGLTLDCIAAMGCVLPIVLRDAPPVPVSPEALGVMVFWNTTAPLHGSDLTPEPEPPTILG